MSTASDQDTPQVSVTNALAEESTAEVSQKEEVVGLEAVERASKAAKVAKQLAAIKKMKSAYSSSTTIDLVTLTSESEIPGRDPLVDAFQEEE